VETTMPMSEAEMQARLVEVAIEEAAQPERWWWLSFAEDAPQNGRGFLGACLVRGHGLVGATCAAHALGINPGGEVCGVEVPDSFSVKSGWAQRLLTREECVEFDRVHKPS